MKIRTSRDNQIFAIGILLLFSTLLVSFLPVNHDPKITTTKVVGENNYLFLSGGLPEELSIEFDLDPLSKLQGEIFSSASFSENALKCFQNLTTVSCRASEKILSIDLGGITGPTTVTVVVQSQGKSISVEAIKEKSTLVLDWPIEITNLKFESRFIENAQFQVREFSIHSYWSAIQKSLYIFSILAALIVFIGMRLTGNRQWQQPRELTKLANGHIVSRTDFLAFGAILLSWLLSYPGFDDGWFRSIQNAQHTTGEFVSYFGGYPELRDVPYPLGTLWNYAMQSLSSSFRLTLATTFVNVVLWSIAWILISRFIVLPWKNQVSYKLVSAIVFSLFVFDSGMSLRPEPFITLLLVLIMAIPAMPWMVQELKICVIALCAMLALITYPTGIGVFLAGFVSVIYLVRSGPLNLKLLSAGALAAIAISTQTLLIGSNIIETFALFKTFANGDVSHGGSPYTEYQRIANVFSMWGGQTQILMLLAYVSMIVISISFITLVGGRTKSEKSNLIFLIHIQSLAVFAGLLATPSKWGWHLLVTLPAVTVTMLVIDSHIKIRSKNQVRVLLSGSFFVAGSALVYLKGGYGAEELRFGTLAQKVLLLNLNSNELLSSLVPWWAWLLFGVIFFELIRRIPTSFYGRFGKSTTKSALALALIPMLLVPSTQLVLPGLLNVFDSGWNFNKQQILGITNGKLKCGIPANTSVVVSATPLQPVNYFFEGRSSGVAESKFLKIAPAQAALPPLGKKNTFWLETNFVEKTGTQIFNKPSGIREVGFWITSDEFKSGIVHAKSAGSKFIIEYIGDNGKKSSKRFTPGTADYWHLVSLKTDDSAGVIRVTIEPDKDFRYLALSPVASIFRVNGLTHLLNSDSSLLLDPTTALFSTCTSQPKITDGIWEIPDYALGTRSRDVPPFDANSPQYQLEMSFVEVGCPKKINSQAKTQQCIFRISR